ncbi:MAG: LD-carboxypeptidase [Acidobacteriota bacterium]
MRRPLAPPPLRPGAGIGVVAPAGPVDRRALERGAEFLERRGYRVVRGEHLHDRRAYLAGGDRERLADLNRFLRDPDVAAVWFARGGYGCARIVSEVDFEPLRRSPKALIGFSDATVVHAAARRAIGLSTFYGPNVSDLGDEGSFDEASLWDVLSAGPAAIRIPLAPARVLRPGAGEGPLVGGCLSVVMGLMGTPHEVALEGAILFWEEVGEEPYRIDRMLAQLRLSGGLARLRGMVVGTLVGCRPRDPRNDLPLADLLRAHLMGTDFPVVIDFPAGHGSGKRTLPLGRHVRLDSAGDSLRFDPV